MTTTETPTRAGRREWVGLAVLALPTFLVSLDVFVLILALPKLSQSLGADSTQQLWIMDVYGFMIAGFMVTMGTLGDRVGRRKLLLVGATAFGLASVLAAFSTSALMLIAARAILGIAGATLAPSTLALISNLFTDARQRSLAIGIWAGCFTVGAIVGPMVGGVLLEHFWWGSVFLLGVPAMVLLLIVGPKFLPEYRNENAGRLDLPSVALSLVTILPAVYGIKELAREGVHVVPLTSLLIGLGFGTVFVRRQRTLKDPLIDLKLFRSRAFSTALGGMCAFTMLGGTTMLFVAQFFQIVLELSPVGAALALLPGMLASTVSFLTAPILARRFRPATLITGGLAGAIAGFLLLTQVEAGAGPVIPSIAFAITCLCGGPLVTLGTDLVVGSVPPEKAGSAASLSQTGNEFGYALGIATVGTLGNAVTQARIADAIPAHDAFASGMHTVSGLAALVLAGIAYFVIKHLRHVRPVGA
ncbi:MFS transporter [Amycolatopsis sp. NPDC051071]|uniref:MFS transporter n=1 Tax=Amycolatopsis sp. NPDC051071 TaxID=3154637 RepID=UPI00341DC0F6